MKIKVIVALVVLGLLSLLGYKFYLENRGFTPWMSVTALEAEYAAMPTGQPGSGDRWITAIQSRWNDGGPQYRIRLEKNPSPGTGSFVWRIEEDQRHFAALDTDMTKQGYTLASFSYYSLPVGEVRRYAGVWHKQATP